MKSDMQINVNLHLFINLDSETKKQWFAFMRIPEKKRCSVAYSLVVLICLSAGIFKPVVGVANNTRHGTGRAELCGEICHRQQ